MSDFPLPPPTSGSTPEVTPPDDRKPRKLVRTAVLVVVPMLVAALVIAGVALFVPRPSVTGLASGAPSTTTTTTTSTASPSPVKPDEPEDTFVIKSKDGKSQVRVPESWEEADGELMDGSQIECGSAIREQYVSVITDSKGDYVDFDSYVDVIKDHIEGFDDFKLKGSDRRKIGGLPAVRFHFSSTFEGVRFVYWVAAVRGKKAYYEVIGWTVRSQEREASGPIRKVIASFRETKPGT